MHFNSPDREAREKSSSVQKASTQSPAGWVISPNQTEVLSVACGGGSSEYNNLVQHSKKSVLFLLSVAQCHFNIRLTTDELSQMLNAFKKQTLYSCVSRSLWSSVYIIQYFSIRHPYQQLQGKVWHLSWICFHFYKKYGAVITQKCLKQKWFVAKNFF